MPYGLTLGLWRPEGKHMPNEASLLHHCSQHELVFLMACGCSGFTRRIYSRRYVSRYGDRLCSKIVTVLFHGIFRVYYMSNH